MLAKSISFLIFIDLILVCGWASPVCQFRMHPMWTQSFELENNPQYFKNIPQSIRLETPEKDFLGMKAHLTIEPRAWDSSQKFAVSWRLKFGNYQSLPIGRYFTFDFAVSSDKGNVKTTRYEVTSLDKPIRQVLDYLTPAGEGVMTVTVTVSEIMDCSEILKPKYDPKPFQETVHEHLATPEPPVPVILEFNDGERRYVADSRPLSRKFEYFERHFSPEWRQETEGNTVSLQSLSSREFDVFIQFLTRGQDAPLVEMTAEQLAHLYDFARMIQFSELQTTIGNFVLETFPDEEKQLFFHLAQLGNFVDLTMSDAFLQRFREMGITTNAQK